MADPVVRPPDAEWLIDAVRYGHPDALRLVAQVQLEYVRRYGGQDDTPLDEDMFSMPRGSFFVGYLDGEAVATGAWRARHDLDVLDSARTAELKRMYVAESARGRGLARAMLAHLERTAAASGAEVMVLETGTGQPEAIALYESCGYLPVALFGHYSDSPLARCFAKRLAPATG